MPNVKTPSRNKVPMGQKAAFGAGHFVLNLLPGVLGVYLQVFILTAFGMDPVWAGLLGGLPRIFDSITDPIMGFISDNTKSRWGRRRPYIFLGAIISGILFFLMWQLDDNASQTYIIWHVMIIQILFLVGNTMFATPLVGLETTTIFTTSTADQKLGENALTVFPNPADEFITATIALEEVSKNVRLTIYNVSGQVMETRNLSNTTNEQVRFDLDNYTLAGIEPTSFQSIP